MKLLANFTVKIDTIGSSVSRMARPNHSSKTTPHSHHLNLLETDLKESTQFEVNGQTYALIEDRQHSHNFAEDISRLLSARELQIATLVALGKANKQIASQLHISEWTVSAHLRRIFVKLGIDSRAAMVYRCTSLLPPSGSDLYVVVT